ncbi:hypothetical protein AeMF1_003294 [Aphanomyces euteiches]|nr:hypothetical protein AeMF1_003294 [Aphanomyces euteiches]
MEKTLVYHYYAFVHKTPKRTSILNGPAWVAEMMNGSPEAFLENFRLNQYVFLRLAEELVQFGGLHGTTNVDSHEQLGIFLYFAGQHASSSNFQQRFQRSGETITCHLRRVVTALRRLASKFIKIPSDNRLVPRKIASNPKFYPFFRNCRMATDGTHIPVSVPASLVAPFQGRKGVTMNEGSAGDGKVYADALTKGYSLSATLFDIMDAGFGLTKQCLTPYRGVRYHLKEFGQGNLRPQDKKELFNLRHAQLRNCVERIFGVLKKRFPVLCHAVEYDYVFQVDLFIALCVVHNFTRCHGQSGDRFEQEVNQEINALNREPLTAADVPVYSDEPESNEATEWRDGIATEMWSQYRETIRGRQ